MKSGSGHTELSRLLAIVEISRRAVLDRNPDETIHDVLEGAVRIISAADLAVLFLYDREDRKLHLAHGVGVGPVAYEMVLEPGEGVAGRTFQCGRGEILNDAAALMNFATRSDDNELKYRRSIAGLGSAHAGLSAAVIYHGQPLGAIVALSLRQEGRFGKLDGEILTSLGQVVAGAVVNSRAYQEQRTLLERAESRTQALAEENRRLQARIAATEAIVDVVRGDLSLETLVSRLSAEVQGQVLAVDSAYRIRASSPSVAESAVRDLYRDHWNQLRMALDTVVRLQIRHTFELGGRGFLVVPIAVGPDVLGLLLLDGCAMECGEGPVELAATVAACELLRERVAMERQVWQWEGASPTGRGGGELVGAWKLSVAVGATCAETPRVERAGHALTILRSLVRERLQAIGLPSAVALRGGAVVATWPQLSDEQEQAIARDLENAAEDLERLVPGWRASFALGRAEDERAVDLLYREARLALGLRTRLGEYTPVFELGSLGAYRLVLSAAAAPESVELCARVLVGLLSQGGKRSQDLLRTVRTYLACGLSVKAAGRALDVHPHTIRYRLNRIQELSGLDLRRGEDRLTLELAVRIIDLAGLRDRGSSPADPSASLAI
jgi:hypothetical protein